VSGEIIIGLPNFATINNSLLSLYIPMVLAYGWNDADVANPLNDPLA